MLPGTVPGRIKGRPFFDQFTPSTAVRAVSSGAVAGYAKLRFVDADKAERSYPDADAVILLTRFIRHRWTEVAYRVFPRGRVHLHRGGISNLVRRIQGIASGNKNVERILA